METHCCAFEYHILLRCLWVSFSTFCIKRGPSQCAPRAVWILGSALQIYHPAHQSPFPPQHEETPTSMLVHMHEVFCQVCTLDLVLWGLVKRLLELEEGKNAYNSLEEPREGLCLFSCFIPVKLFIGICWKVPFSHCTLPLVCQWYISLRRCCASKNLHGDSGLVGWWFTLLHGHQTLRFLLWGSCPVLELLSLSGSSQLTEAKGVKPKHFMGSLFDARISLVSQCPP